MKGVYMLLSYQKNNLEKLSSATKEYKNITIVGKKDSGRKYVIDEWSKSIEHSLVIQLVKTGLNCEYASLVSALKKICRIEKHRIAISPNVGISFSVYTLGISLSVNNDSILKSEKVIRKCIKKLLRKYTLIFVIDEAVNIDDESIELLDNIITNYKGKNIVYRFKLSTQKNSNDICLYFDSISTCTMSKIEILRNLNLNPQIQLRDNVIGFIFNNIEDNIKLLINIINNINNDSLDYTLEEYDTNNLIKILLDESLKNYDNSALLKRLLHIYAINKYYFKTLDLAFLLEQSDSTINTLQEYAQNHYLIEGDASCYHIIFGIVKKIYAELDDISKQSIYMSIVNMFSHIYPSDYYNKYVFADLAQSRECNVYLIQFLFQEIRLNHNINISDYSDSLNEEELAIVNAYNYAFGLLNEKEYEKCIKTINSFKDLSGALLYEINILKSQCLIRLLDKQCRQQGLRGLNYNNSNTAIDENLKFRLDIRKIAAYIHVGQYCNALEICADVKERLIKMYEKTKAIEYAYYLNVIYRKYTYVSEYDLSINEVKESVDFFRKHQKDYFKAFYIALNNLFSLYIIMMNLEEAEKIKIEIDNLKLLKNSINFSRKEIFLNNTILYNYFAEKITAEEGMAELAKLCSETTGTADHTLIASNHAVFAMLNNKLIEAKEILLKELQIVNGDPEGVYIYRVKINLAICEFLLDNDKRCESLKQLAQINYNQEDPHYKVRNQELSGIINLMETVTNCNDATKWCAEYKSHINTVLNAYTTYQQGLVYTTLFNWDDD